MSATDILRICDEVLAARDNADTPFPWTVDARTSGLSPDDAAFVAISANCAPALAEYVKRLHEAAAAAGVDLDRMTLRGHGTR